MANDPRSQMYQNTDPFAPGRARAVAGVPRSGERSTMQSDRVRALTQMVTTLTAFRGVGDPDPRVVIRPEQRNPHAPWISSYPSAPGRLANPNVDPTAARDFIVPGEAGTPRSPDPRATLAVPVRGAPARYYRNGR